ncbi:MAG: helix-turn-helix transcriptional regulator [Bacteroidota bacterium]|nr:helix-turn-helix transcriptional regulator [Bacteroidota bacterium]
MISDITIGKNIKLYREINGFTQDAIAKFLDIKREMISYYENGLREIPFEILSRLSDLYGVDLADFYEENESVVKENVACAFRTNGFDNEDLESIAKFKAVVKNYLKMNNLLSQL